VGPSLHNLRVCRYFFFSRGIRLSRLGTPATVWPILPTPDDGWWWRMWSNRWNANWQGKPKYIDPVPLCPPQIPHYLTRTRTLSAAVGSRRLMAWAMAQPRLYHVVTLDCETLKRNSIALQWHNAPTKFCVNQIFKYCKRYTQVYSKKMPCIYCLSVYDSKVFLLDLDRFFSFLIRRKAGTCT
jgi:hypothetical protein